MSNVKAAIEREQNEVYFDYAEREQTRGEVRVKPCRELKILCPDIVKTSPQNYEKRTQVASKTTTIFTLFSHKKSAPKHESRSIN